MNQIIPWNRDWQFRKEGGTWEEARLPHTPQLEAADASRPWQGRMTYRKVVTIPAEYQDCRVAVTFEGAMNNAVLLVNGHVVCRHFGGYLPFTADIGRHLRFGEENEILVKLDNRDDGKTASGVDFLYYGELYRAARLTVTPRLHLSDAVQAGRTGGGLVITTKHISRAHAILSIRANIENDWNKTREGILSIRILDPAGAVVSRTSAHFSADAQRCCDIAVELEVVGPSLWTPDTPSLYTCLCETQASGLEPHTCAERFGIRTAAVDETGFLLNGKPLCLFGVNRRQQVPYLGIASSDEAEKREALRLKQLGINTVHLRHCPQSPAFLSACDEAGLLLIEPAPGWQYARRGVFQKRLMQNLRNVIRRDRNHPSVVIYEISSNETGFYRSGASDRFFRKLRDAAKEELPGCLTAGDVAGRRDAERVAYDLPYTDEDQLIKKRPSYTGRPFLTREYGDWAFGGGNSTSRVTRGDGEAAQLLQAWNFQWGHNNQFNERQLAGDILGEGIDHARGYAPDARVSHSGLLDLFRLPKFSAYFFQSQRDAHTPDEAVLFPAAWTVKGRGKLIVYSNCEEVALFAGERELARQLCDHGPSAPFLDGAHEEIRGEAWMTDADPVETGKAISDLAKHTINCQFDGGNCENVRHPPFTFTGLPGDCEELTAVAYLGGEEVRRVTLREPGKAAALLVTADTQGVPLRADGVDFVYVYAALTDENGTVVPFHSAQVMLRVAGGHTVYTDKMETEAGIAPFLVQAEPGAERVVITASAPGMVPASLALQTQQAE